MRFPPTVDLRLIALLLVGLCLLTLAIVVTAQEVYLLPEDLQPITVNNAIQLQKLASIGGNLPGKLVWSPDSSVLGVGTVIDTRLYNTSNFELPPRIIPVYGNFSFNMDGDLVVNDQRWNAQTGEHLGSRITPNASFTDNQNGTPVAQVIKEGEQTIVELHKPDGDVTSLNLGSNNVFVRIVFSQDERFAALILSSYINGYFYPTVQLWNIADGTLIAELPPTLEILDTVAFHADGKLLIVATTTEFLYGGPFEDVQIWDGRTGERIGPRTYSYLPVHFNPDGTLLAFMTSEGIALWTDHELGILKFNTYSESGQVPIIFSLDGGTIITNTEHEILLWDVSTEQIPDTPRQLITTERSIANLLYSPDGSRIASIETDGIIEIWDAQAGVRQTRISASGSVYRARFSPDGQLLHGYEFGGDQVLWNVQTGETILTLPQHTNFNADLSQAAYWDGGVVRVANTNTGQEILLTIIPDFLGNIAAFSPSVERVIFTGTEMIMYDLRNGEQIFSELISDRAPRIRFTPNGDRFITGTSPIVSGRGDPFILTIRETQNPGQLLTRFEIPDGGGDWLLSPDGRYLSNLNTICGEGGGGSLLLWDAETGDRLVGWRPGSSCGPNTHFFSLDGKWLIVGWDYELVVLDMAILIEEAATTDFFSQTMPAAIGGLFYNQPIHQVTLSPDGSRLAVTLTFRQYDSTEPSTIYWVALYQFADFLKRLDNQTLLEIGVQIPDAQQAIFSPDNQWVLTETGFWDSDTGEQMANMTSKTASFNPDSTILATATDEAVTLWDVSALVAGSTSRLITLNIENTREFAFSPDGSRLYIRQTGEIQVWGVPKS